MRFSTFFALVFLVDFCCAALNLHSGSHPHTHRDHHINENNDHDAQAVIMAGKTQSLNVLKTQLALFSKQPMTGFYRNGYCDVGADDTGNHSVAATLTEPFLDFTASRGNNLRSIGLTGGCKWCLCAARWKEALEFAKKEGKDGKEVGLVPTVNLESTHESALRVVALEDLQRFKE